MATVLGVGLTFTSVNTTQALFGSAVINGVIAVPVMAIMMLMVVNPKTMGAFIIGRKMRVLGWCATIAMALAVMDMMVTL